MRQAARRRRRLLVPALSTAVMLAILIALGVWQLHRLTWKRGILAAIATAEAAPPVPLPAHPSPFVKVELTGRLRADLAAFYGAETKDGPRGPVLGAHLIEPLERPGTDTVLVDRGWVPDERSQPIGHPAGEATVTGYVMPAQHPHWFSATDDTVQRRFYTLDPARIGAVLGLPRVAPYVVVALGTPPPAGYPDPARHLPRPPNDHLRYALTWFGFALTLVIVFALYVRKVCRE